jgi:hypothetical protein
VTPVQPQPYRLDVHDDVLDDLRERLARTRWPDEIPESDWQYGANLAFMRRLTDRWRDGFDWRAQEARLNAFEQFRVPLDGIDLHFIHQPGVGPDPLPLLLVHGWPGSVWEFHELIPRLTDPAGSVVTQRTRSRSSLHRCPASRSRSSQASRVWASSRWPISLHG